MLDRSLPAGPHGGEGSDRVVGHPLSVPERGADDAGHDVFLHHETTWVQCLHGLLIGNS
jgi:hypothetical protein